MNDDIALMRLKIRKSYLLTATGLMKEAIDVMNTVDVSKLPLQLKKEYFSQMVYLYSHLGNYRGGNFHGNRYYDIERAYKDSLARIISPADTDYLWHEGWRRQNAQPAERREIMKLLRDEVEHSNLNSREDAQNAYILAILCKEEGDNRGYINNLIKSAIADVSISNKDVASLQDLASLCYDLGELDRAYSYIDYCLDASLLYPNRVRAISIAPLQNKINRAYQERNKQQELRVRIFLLVVCVLSIILAVALIVIYKQNKRLTQRRTELDAANSTLNQYVKDLFSAQSQLTEANTRLQSLNDRLKSTNEQLREANYVKEEYIGYAFSRSSSYIRKLDEFRRSINRKAKAKQWDDIRTMTDSQAMAKDELKEFFANFDSIFLHIYPDFVNNFNALLLPDERIYPKEGELLNTELRIYALVRLGITDSVKIAEFLHCSPQTVYNNRFRVRSKSIISKEKFLEAVKRL
jgi:type II secretory pathway pseudopilin PulG